jgi:hypothetical protein
VSKDTRVASDPRISHHFLFSDCTKQINNCIHINKNAYLIQANVNTRIARNCPKFPFYYPKNNMSSTSAIPQEFLWVRYGRFIDTVSTQGCQDVHDFRKAIHKEFGSKFSSYEPMDLELSFEDGGEPIDPGLLLSELAQQPGYKGNSDLNPIYVKVIPFQGVNPGK